MYHPLGLVCVFHKFAGLTELRNSPIAFSCEGELLLVLHALRTAVLQRFAAFVLLLLLLLFCVALVFTFLFLTREKRKQVVGCSWVG